ncbi:MAG: helix-turn-helix domain-containing protein [Prolixibacteraceae bacterium]|nr:helix-turn-helix domain-containing protein [Prolixibacteraceae bacterium]
MDINDKILSLNKNLPDAVLKGIAKRVKDRRLDLALTQKELALRSGIPLSTYRRFERNGEISLRSLVMLGIALDNIDDFNELFSVKKYSNLDELLKLNNKKRKRGKSHG